MRRSNRSYAMPKMSTYCITEMATGMSMLTTVSHFNTETTQHAKSLQ